MPLRSVKTPLEKTLTCSVTTRAKFPSTRKSVGHTLFCGTCRDRSLYIHTPRGFAARLSVLRTHGRVALEFVLHA